MHNIRLFVARESYRLVHIHHARARSRYWSSGASAPTVTDPLAPQHSFISDRSARQYRTLKREDTELICVRLSKTALKWGHYFCRPGSDLSPDQEENNTQQSCYIHNYNTATHAGKIQIFFIRLRINQPAKNINQSFHLIGIKWCYTSEKKSDQAEITFITC